MRLKDKLAVITAAASGMGRSGCEIFAREGAHVVGIDIDAAGLGAVRTAIAESGGRMDVVTADLSSVEGCREALSAALRILGGNDVLWCHAGTPGPSGIEGLDIGKYRFAMELNLTSAIVMTGEVAAPMRERGGGSIIYTSSVGGLVGSPTSPVYSAAKFGVVGLAKAVAIDYARHGIRANALCPGPIDTPMHLEFMGRGASAEIAEQNRQKVIASVPLGRTGRPEDVAYAALWLASNESDFVTGTAIPIDGGYTCR